MFDTAAYRDQLLQLLPPGKAWPRAPDSIMGQFAAALADEFARIDARADVLHDEADPRTTLELLPDWERVAGLPDACAGVPTETRERQVALSNKLAQLGGQSIAYFTSIAARLGYYVEIEEFTSCDAGLGAGDDCNGDDWRHSWRVDVLIGFDEYRAGYAEFTAGSSAGDRLLGYGALDLECMLGRSKPAHSQIIFAYIVEPEAALWFDFTKEDA